MAPIDHTFRYYEPENSHYEILVPPFIQLSHPGLIAVVSDPMAKIEAIPSTNMHRIRGQTGDAMSKHTMTMFIFGSQFNENLIATCRIEVNARSVLFVKTRVGEKCRHAIQYNSRILRSNMGQSMPTSFTD
jgi:hypothetical protein